MLKILSFFLLMLFSINSYSAGCLEQEKIDKWEVISSKKLLAYSSGKYYAFIYLSSFTTLKTGGDVTLRFFSPTICNYDTVIVNGMDNRISSIELIRQQ